MTITALVARIISDREAALNVGSEHGVKIGDVATVYREIVVTDPESREEIGIVKRPAVRLQIVEVQDRLSVGQTFETLPAKREDVRENAIISPLAAALGAMLQTVVRLTENPDAADKWTILVLKGWETVIDPSVHTA